MTQPAIYASGSLLVTLPYPQKYQLTQIATWSDYVSLNKTLRRDFSDLHKRYLLNLGWEIVTASELADLQTIWYNLSAGSQVLTYVDVEGVTWTVRADTGSFNLNWAPATIGLNGSWQTVYNAALSFVCVSSSTLTIP